MKLSERQVCGLLKMNKINIAVLLILLCGQVAFGGVSDQQKWLNPTFSEQEVAQYQQKASEGHLPSMYFFSLALSKGRGVERDCTNSFKLAYDAARKGFKPAYYLVAMNYHKGCGVDANQAEAEKWFSKFTSWATQEKKPLSPVTIGNLGWCYSTGHGVSKDPEKAFSLFNQASKQGHMLSMANLGWCYMVGRGVSEDHARAFQCFETAALKGSDVAQRWLGLAYLNGMGTATNVTEGIRWLQMSSDKMNVDAQYDLALRYADGTVVQRDYKRAQELLKMASAGGNRRASELLPTVEKADKLQSQLDVLIQATNALSKVKCEIPPCREALSDFERKKLDKKQHELQMFDRLESFMGMEFGQPLDVTKFKKAAIANWYKFKPAKTFRGFSECLVEISPISHRVVAVESESVSTKYDSDEFDIVKALIEKKYEKEMVLSFPKDGSQFTDRRFEVATLHLFSGENLRSVSLTKYFSGKLSLRASDQHMSSLRYQEQEEAKRRKAEPSAKDIDAL